MIVDLTLLDGILHDEVVKPLSGKHLNRRCPGLCRGKPAADVRGPGDPPVRPDCPPFAAGGGAGASAHRGGRNACMATAPDSPDLIQPAKRGGRMSHLAAVEEVAVWLEVNGRPVVTWMCTPDLLEELAVGWLHGEGYIDSIEQVHLRPCATDLGFWAEIPPERVAAVQAEGRKPVLASGCGAVSTFLADPGNGREPGRRGDRFPSWSSSAACSRSCSPGASGTRTPAEFTPPRWWMPVLRLSSPTPRTLDGTTRWTSRWERHSWPGDRWRGWACW